MVIDETFGLYTVTSELKLDVCAITGTTIVADEPAVVCANARGCQNEDCEQAEVRLMIPSCLRAGRCLPVMAMRTVSAPARGESFKKCLRTSEDDAPAAGDRCGADGSFEAGGSSPGCGRNLRVPATYQSRVVFSTDHHSSCPYTTLWRRRRDSNP